MSSIASRVDYSVMGAELNSEATHSNTFFSKAFAKAKDVISDVAEHTKAIVTDAKTALDDVVDQSKQLFLTISLRRKGSSSADFDDGVTSPTIYAINTAGCTFSVPTPKTLSPKGLSPRALSPRALLGAETLTMVIAPTHFAELGPFDTAELPSSATAPPPPPALRRTNKKLNRAIRNAFKGMSEDHMLAMDWNDNGVAIPRAIRRSHGFPVWFDWSRTGVPNRGACPPSGSDLRSVDWGRRGLPCATRPCTPCSRDWGARGVPYSPRFTRDPAMTYDWGAAGVPHPPAPLGTAAEEEICALDWNSEGVPSLPNPKEELAAVDWSVAGVPFKIDEAISFDWGEAGALPFSFVDICFVDWAALGLPYFG